MTPPSHGSGCALPLAPRSAEWRAGLADELDAADSAAIKAGLIIELGQFLPDNALYATIRQAIMDQATDIMTMQTRRINEAVEELGQLRAGIRALCPQADLPMLEHSQ